MKGSGHHGRHQPETRTLAGRTVRLLHRLQDVRSPEERHPRHLREVGAARHPGCGQGQPPGSGVPAQLRRQARRRPGGTEQRGQYLLRQGDGGHPEVLLPVK